jgi:hypothetical protein
MLVFLEIDCVDLHYPHNFTVAFSPNSQLLALENSALRTPRSELEWFDQL